MNKNENKELNAILAQLKKSYSGDEDIEKAQDEEVNDDFQAMLSNYFSDDSNKDIYKFTSSNSSDENSAAMVSEYSLADFEEFKVEEEIVEEEIIEEEIIEEEIIEEEIIEEEIIEEKIIEEKIIEEEIIEEEIIEEEIIEEKIIEEEIVEEEIVEEEIVDDKAIVDDVFAVMFPHSVTADNEEPNDEIKEEIKEEIIDKVIIEESSVTKNTTESVANSKMFDLEESEDYDYEDSGIIDMPTQGDAYAFSTDDVSEAEFNEDFVLVSDVAKTEEREEHKVYSEVSVNNDSIQESKETIDQIIGDMKLDDEDDIVLDISAILTKEEDSDVVVASDEINEGIAETQVYLSDPLQGHLSDAAFVAYKISGDEVNFDVDEEAPELDDEEISLLLDFGYDDEAEAEAGHERTNEIKRRNSGEVSSFEESKIFGYCGEEYTQKIQSSQIKDRYVKDKKDLLIKSVVLISITAILFFMAIINCFGTNVNYRLYSLIEILLLCVISLVSFTGLKKGVLGLFKLEPNYYSVPAIVIAITALYDVFSIIYVSVTPEVIFQGTLLPCGFFAGIYVLAVVLSEYFECMAEAEAFEVISSADELYTAERFNKSNADSSSSHTHTNTPSFSGASLGDNVFEIRRTTLPKGYFNRVSKKQNYILGSFYLSGAVFVAALIIGLVSLIKANSIALAAYSSMVVILMGMPMSYALYKAIPKLASTLELKEKNCAIVGDMSSVEYSSVEALIFDDCDAIEIIDKLEIRPEGDSDVASSVRIASRALAALGGPISMITGSLVSSDEGSPEISLVSVRDNGIEFYMDSTIYMLIGDASFMSAYGIKVSSDCGTSGIGHNNIIYIAIDGVPRLGYIINSKVKEEFISLVTELDKHGIKSAVKSYDPTVNDYYFEQNKIYGVSTISSYKPDYFYSRDAQYMADGGIFSVGDSKKIIYPLIESKKMNALKKKNKMISLLCSVLGCIVGAIFVIFVLLDNPERVVTFATIMLMLIFHGVSILPTILNSFDLKKKRKRDSE